MSQISIKGTQYPCRQVLGGMIALKRQYGVEVGEVGADTEKLAYLIYSYTKCSCAADGVAFDVDFDTFINSVELNDLTDLTQKISEGGKKKE